MAAVSGVLPAQAAAGATSTTLLGKIQTTVDNEQQVTEVSLNPPAGFTTVTGVATNNVTFNFRQLRAGTSLGTFATVTLGSGTNLVAETPLQVPVTAPVVLLEDDDIDVQMVQNGTGLAVGAGVIAQVEAK